MSKTPTGRELDALVAEHVMGVRVEYRHGELFFPNPDSRWFAVIPIPDWSSDMDAAWRVVEYLRSQGFVFGLQELDEPYDEHRWRAVFSDGNCRYGGADTASHAICLAALRAVGYKFEEVSV